MNDSNRSNGLSLRRVIVKGVLLFLLVNFLFALVKPLPVIGHTSAYNWLFPGRVRLPYGERPDEAYNFSLFNLEAMFASHELSARQKPVGEYRVLLIGDSSVWGYLLKPSQTLAAFINSSGLKTSDGKSVKAYNLGYPTMSLAKDLLILSLAIQYNPDLIIWLVTLESFPLTRQLDSPIVQNNPVRVKALINQYSINLDPRDKRFVEYDFLGSTLVGQRRALADIFRLQLYGVMWSATGIDQYYPKSYEPPQEDLEKDDTFHDLMPPVLKVNDLSFDILAAGTSLAENIPVIFVNEPIYISHGENSDIRYNFFYPRWAYDQYRVLLSGLCHQNGWICLDEWNLVSPVEFTNSAIHMTPVGTQKLASELEEAIYSITSP